MKPSAKPKSNVKEVSQSQVEKTNKSTFIYFILIVFCFILYGNTLSSDYALDDGYVITGNSFTKKGLQGLGDIFTKHFFAGYLKDQQVGLVGGRYRPLSLATFAIEHEFFGQNAHISHFLNILFYAATVILLFLVLKKLFDKGDMKRWYISVPFLGALLFCAHPVHTEVVANIKGRDEIMALLGSLAAWWCFLRYLENGKTKHLIYSGIAFFLALMSKENAATFLLLIPLSALLLKKEKLRKITLPMVPLILSMVIFWGIRQWVLGGFPSQPSTELMDNPFLFATDGQKYATIIYTLGIYLKLLFFPHPLTWDYYPYHISLKEWNDPVIWLILGIYLAMLIISLVGIFKRKVYGFALSFYLVTILLISNLFFTIGAFMAERFLFIPSVAFCLLAGWFISSGMLKWFKSSKLHMNVILAIMSVVLILYSGKTISRNRAWKDDYTLYTTDVKTSVNSAKSNNMAGAWIAYISGLPENESRKQELLKEAIKYYRKALEIHPVYQDVLFKMGNCQWELYHQPDSVLVYYKRLLFLDREENHVYTNLELILKQIQDPAEKIRILESVYPLNPDRYELNYNLALAYPGKDLRKAIHYMEKALQKNSSNQEMFSFIGSAYFALNDYRMAAIWFEKALHLNPQNKAILDNLYYAYNGLGEKEKAAEYLRLSQQIPVQK